jgi:alpha-L-arabinofuranosidase
VTTSLYDGIVREYQVAAIATREDSTGDVILKVVNMTGAVLPYDISVKGVGELAPTATMLLLSGELADVNSIDEPERVTPRKSVVTPSPNRLRVEFPAHSVTVIRMPVSR